MKINDYKTTANECDNRTWVYSNGNSITFSEIEQDLNNKIKNMKVRLYGEYDAKYLQVIEPYVIARFETKEGYIRTIQLEKNIFKERNTYDGYYDFIINQTISALARAMFKKENEEGKE